MKILHAITSMQKAAGTSVFCGELSNGLAAKGHDVTIAVCDSGQADVYPLDYRVKLVPIASILQTTNSKLQTPNFSLVHIHALWTPILHAVSNWAYKNNMPVVWSPHGMLTPWAFRYKWWKKLPVWLLYQKKDLQRAALIHVTADSEIKDVRRVGLTNKTIIAPLGVHLDCR